MVKPKINMIGQRYNRLLVIAYAPDYIAPNGKHFTNCLCKCDCGKLHSVRACSLRSGLVKSCGCISREKSGAHLRKHGLSHRDPLYSTWKGMRQRCRDPKTKCYHRYGGRGISVCAEWDDFTKFRSWALEHGWHRGLQIDRIDGNGNYSPENCRIVTCKENNEHRGSRRDCKGRYVKSPV